MSPVKPVHMRKFADDQAHGLVDVPANDFDSFVKIEGKTFKSMLESLHCHNMVDFRVTFVTQKSLLCTLQVTRDSVSMVALCGGASFYACFSHSL
jgi:hypothetical protein